MGLPILMFISSRDLAAVDATMATWSKVSSERRLKLCARLLACTGSKDIQHLGGASQRGNSQVYCPNLGKLKDTLHLQ